MVKTKKEPVPKEEKTPAIKVLSLPNHSLSVLYNLLNVPLHGAMSRARNHFAIRIRTAITKLEDERIAILESYAEKDENGAPKKKGEGDNEEYDLTPENLLAYRKEFDALMKENYVIDLLPSVKPDVVLVRPLILDSKTELSTVEGYVYDEICAAFETV